MTTTSKFVGAGGSLTDLDPSVLGTAEFRAAIAELGYPEPAARLGFDPSGDRGWRLTVVVPQEVPWRVTEMAVVRALDQVHAARPDVQVASRRFAPVGSGT